MRKALLAYGMGPKSKEALFLSAYLAGKWDMELVVLTVAATSRPDAVPDAEEPRSYLEDQGISARLIHEQGAVARTILRTAESQGADLIIIGGYAGSPFRDLVHGSVLERVLQGSTRPVLICH